MIDGTDLDDSLIVWDEGTPRETVIPGSYQGAYMFSVPPGAAPNIPHWVVVRNSSGKSARKAFTVLAPAVPFPKPRIDAVTLNGTSFDNQGYVTAGLYVQGANLDVGAVVLINGVEAATTSHKILRHGIAVPATELGYAIEHYGSTLVETGIRTPGETLTITVRNLGGQVSDAVSYKLPADAASVDSDGDGLLDSWETQGYDSDGDGVIDVDLPRLGTDSYRRDILVEIDVMAADPGTQEGLAYPPGPAAFDGLRAMFNAAPVLNPNGPPGINLILDTLGTVPYEEQVCFDLGTASGCEDSESLRIAKFSTLKAKYFDNVHRDKIFHYAIWGKRLQSLDDPGQSDTGDDFVIGFDEWTPTSVPPFNQSVRAQIEELAHELGHDLGLHHGGGTDDDYPYRPNHWSVMSYSWDGRIGMENQWRLDHATCPPMYYGQLGADTSPTGSPPPSPGTVTDYSSGIAKALVPPARGTVKVCGKLVNLDQDGIDQTMTDVADWPRLKFDGPVRNGWLVP